MSPVLTFISKREIGKISTRIGKESVCSSGVTHLADDGFSKPGLIYWPSMFALCAPFSIHEERLRENVCVLRGGAMSSLTHSPR